ncbi:MAG TPA: nuclear transport factor 2 family protein [Stellaceae bacterium]|jgi:hypothetical protein|nr:nuclear transport factor 2 family protein [Stellaceae bacterium]
MAKSLEERIGEIEDRLEIYNLIASHPPSADTGSRAHVANAWTEDGTFDRGAEFGGPQRQSTNAGGIDNPEHMHAISQGLAHFSGLPYVQITGDTAYAISYLQILVPDRVGPEFECRTTARAAGSTFTASPLIAGILCALQAAGRSANGSCERSTAMKARGKFCSARSPTDAVALRRSIRRFPSW